MNLQDFFDENKEVAIAFSGGVDSAYLLYEAKQYAQIVRAYYVKSSFQPEFELTDAKEFANWLGVDLKIMELNVLENLAVIKNDTQRCYFCKKMIFSEIKKQATLDGLNLLLDGTNASDDFADRPGMLALQELEVRSPLRECNLTKAEIRIKSKELGLKTADKPAYSCLATRIMTGCEITQAKLSVIEKAEVFLFQLGFSDFRVRFFGDAARIQLSKADLKRFLDAREIILDELKQYYPIVLLDLETRD